MSAPGAGDFPAELLATSPDSPMNRLMAATDWSTTPLGPVEGWPSTLRTAVSICLNSRFPMLIWRGPELAMLYNDAYVPMLGAKHPASLGRPGAQVWADVWPVVGKLLDAVLERREATWSEDLLLVMYRHGFVEEAYFTFSHSPILDADGALGGVFTAVSETTPQVLGTRRLATLQALGEVRAARTGSVEAVCASAMSVLAASRADLPFGAVYLADDDGSGARLAAGFGLRDEAMLPATLPADGLGQWIGPAVTAGQVCTHSGLARQQPGLSSPGASPAGDADVDTLVALPLTVAGQDRPVGALVVGVSPYLRLDADYRSFLDLVAGELTAAVLDAQAYASQRRRAEELAELDRVKTEFFSNVSHELRTPLALIAAPVEDSLNDAAHPLGPAQRERLEVVHRNVGRLRRMVDTLLDFSRLESGRMTLEPAPVDLGMLTRGIVESFAPAAHRAGLTMTIDCPDSGRPLLVDPAMWEKIVLNLLSNAVKFTPRGEVGISLRTSGPTVQLDVRDTGVGIPEAELPLVFQRFHRVRGAEGRSFEGTGIGLALVQELAGLHGGRAEVASRPGVGSTFTVTIPLVEGGTAAVVAPPSGAVARYRDEALQWSVPAVGAMDDAAPGAGSARATVLVADDNADLRRYLIHLLEPAYRVLAAADGEAALTEVRRHRPDLVLADVMMPRMDGRELLRSIRADPVSAGTPVILLSARAGEPAAIAGLTAGADDYLVKPFSSAELLARVHTHLELAGARVRESRRLQDLARATAEINGASTPRQALDMLARSARQLIGAHGGVATLVGDDGRETGTAVSLSAEYAAGVPEPVAVATTPEADVAGAALSTPLRAADGTRMGLVRLWDRYEGEFTADDEAVLTQLAGIGSAVLEKARLLQRQTDVALTLQRSILGPELLPEGFAVRYEPAAGTLEVGGDWYDVVCLPDGRFAVVVGDVVGRGLPAAAVMGQLRSAGRALLLEHRNPAEVLTALDMFAALIPGAGCSTVFCALIDAERGTLCYSSAGHVPAILVEADGSRRLLDGARSLPLAVQEVQRREESTDLPAGSTLLLYTDGLVERRTEPLDVGIDRTASVLAAGRGLAPDVLVDRLVEELLGDGHDDDVAVLVYRRPVAPQPFTRLVSAAHVELAAVRRDMHAWLTAAGADQETADDLVLATEEALANAIEHGCRLDRAQTVRLDASVSGPAEVTVVVRDPGRWVEPRPDPGHRGRGLVMMRALADSAEVEVGPGGTTCRLVRALSRPGAG